MYESHVLLEVIGRKRNNLLNVQCLKVAYIKVLSVKHLNVRQYTHNEHSGNLVYNSITI
jgi:hypothetical protein